MQLRQLWNSYCLCTTWTRTAHVPAIVLWGPSLAPGMPITVPLTAYASHAYRSRPLKGVSVAPQRSADHQLLSRLLALPQERAGLESETQQLKAMLAQYQEQVGRSGSRPCV